MSTANDTCGWYDEILPEFTFVWKITKFSYCSTSPGQSLVSPSFKFQSIDCKDRSEAWQLFLYPRGTSSISTLVICSVKNVSKISRKIDYSFCVCTAKQKLLYKETGEITCHYVRDYEEFLNFAKFGREVFDKLADDIIVLHFHTGKRTSNKTENLVYCFATTHLSIHRRTFCWKVENFCTLQLQEKKSFGLSYPTSDSTIYLTLKLFLWGKDLQEATVHIWFTFDGLKAQVFSSCDLFIKDENEKVVKSMKKESWIGPLENIVKFSLQRKEITTWGLQADSLVLKGEVNISGGDNTYMGSMEHAVYGMNMRDAIAAVEGSSSPEVSFTNSPSLSSEKDRSLSLSADMLSLFKSAVPKPDFELLVAGRSFPVHQTVLGARSTVFRAMFASDMLEASKRSLELTDIDVGTAERMLLYAYSDQEPSMDLDWDSLCDLYAAADKYALMGLKKTCGDRLFKGIDLDNASILLKMADRHSDLHLKEQVIEYLVSQGPMAFESENWMNLEEEDPKLAIRVMRQIIKQN